MNPQLDNHLMAATEMFARGDVEQALEKMGDLEAACASDAERSQVLARYASFFHLLELREEELSAIAEALALDPSNARAHYLKALHMMVDEQWDDAVSSLASAANHYPSTDHVHLAEVYGNLSYCWAQLGDPDRAEMYEAICADLDPEGVAVEEGEEGALWPEEFEV